MKVTFPILKEGSHRYCMVCHVADTISDVVVNDMFKRKCSACGAVSDRYIHIGNEAGDAKWWLDEDSMLRHESSGVFVRNPDGKYLFFERTSFPFGYTIPAGHVDHDEDGAQAAARELGEEVGIESKRLTHIASPEIVDDKCGSGADTHKWNIYREDLEQLLDVKVLEEDEGRHPAWMTLDEVRQKEMPPAIRYLLDTFADQIEA
jgi:8-oxo-dGTP pyrophosphatase MutT (NUDIX family)